MSRVPKRLVERESLSRDGGTIGNATRGVGGEGLGGTRLKRAPSSSGKRLGADPRPHGGAALSWTGTPVQQIEGKLPHATSNFPKPSTFTKRLSPLLIYLNLLHL